MLATAKCVSFVIVEQALVVGYVGWFRSVALARPQTSDAPGGASSGSWSSPYLH